MVPLNSNMMRIYDMKFLKKLSIQDVTLKEYLQV